MSPEFSRSAWEVFVLFLIPVGGGIPGGVVLGHARGLGWPVLLGLYFVSDVVLALVFEPVLVGLRHFARHSPRLQNVFAAYRVIVQKQIERLGVRPSPLKLIWVSFGIDPMTGRAAALAAGYGFVGGWLIAIAGDLIFFSVLMASTLWLNNVLGDGTWASVVILVLMFGVPALVRRWRARGKPLTSPAQFDLVTQPEEPHDHTHPAAD